LKNEWNTTDILLLLGIFGGIFSLIVGWSYISQNNNSTTENIVVFAQKPPQEHCDPDGYCDFSCNQIKDKSERDLCKRTIEDYNARRRGQAWCVTYCHVFSNKSFTSCYNDCFLPLGISQSCERKVKETWCVSGTEFFRKKFKGELLSCCYFKKDGNFRFVVPTGYWSTSNGEKYPVEEEFQLGLICFDCSTIQPISWQPKLEDANAINRGQCADLEFENRRD